MRNLRRFLLFMLLFAVVSTLIQVYVFDYEEPINLLIFKNVLTGAVAAAFFTFLVRHK